RAVLATCREYVVHVPCAPAGELSGCVRDQRNRKFEHAVTQACQAARHFQNDEAAIKHLCPTLRNVLTKTVRAVVDWASAMNQLLSRSAHDSRRCEDNALFNRVIHK
ncbi:hypothetical protein, partial [Burkholderia metallica]|uniref:hypothetical protein n=1 Tax=Burkholderia metallica TaxID=488729 RepID=UPI001C2D7016